ncbi:MAG: O-antigen ligase family protein [Candidatus Omnitrophica bacterium]|nr:O-antigen ligase family protein [Candidatus Omnitrophota bacterium]
MPILPKFDMRIVLTFLLSICVGFIFVDIIPLIASNSRLLVLFPIGLLFLVYMVINPRNALVIIIILRPLLDQMLESTRMGGSQGMGFGAIFNLAIIFIFVFLYFQNATQIPAPKNFLRLWVIFLIVIVPSIFYSPFVLRAIRLYLNHISYFAMAMLPFLLIKRKEDFVFWLKVFMVSFILPMIVANIDMATGGRYYNPDSGRRIMGSFTHPNILAFYLLLGVTTYFLVLRSKFIAITPKIKFWLYVGMANMLVLIVAAKTRSAWLSALMVFFIYGWLKEKKIIVILLLLCSLAALTPAVQDRVMTMMGSKGVENYEGENSFSWRLQAWGSAFPAIFKQPLHGYGLTSFRILSANFSNQGEAFGAHNVYVETWFEAGIFALISYCMLLFAPFWIFWQRMKESTDPTVSRLSALLASYVATYILICISDNLAYYLVFNWYYWFFVGLIMVALKLEK